MIHLYGVLKMMHPYRCPKNDAPQISVKISYHRSFVRSFVQSLEAHGGSALSSAEVGKKMSSHSLSDGTRSGVSVRDRAATEDVPEAG
jgi:hypothetical protein